MVPRRRALGPTAWKTTDGPSGVSLVANIRLEDALPNRVLRAAVPVRGAQQREAPARPVLDERPGGERHVSPSIATFPYGEADQLQPAQRAGFAAEDHFRIGKLPCGSVLPDWRARYMGSAGVP